MSRLVNICFGTLYEVEAPRRRGEPRTGGSWPISPTQAWCSMTQWAIWHSCTGLAQTPKLTPSSWAFPSADPTWHSIEPTLSPHAGHDEPASRILRQVA